jgi:CBS domain-containing protein
MKARDIMTSDPFTATLSDSVRRAADIMRELNIGAVPIVEDRATPVLRGIITDRDIAVRCTAEGHAPLCPVRDHMTALPLQTVGPDDDVADVIEQMERAAVRRIPVISSDGVLVGIIAQADLATKLGPKDARMIEELLERISAAAVPTA